jgi:hypothetical protein
LPAEQSAGLACDLREHGCAWRPDRASPLNQVPELAGLGRMLRQPRLDRRDRIARRQMR